MAREAGRLPDGWRGDNYFDGGVNVSDVPDPRFSEIWHAAYRRFYLNPRRLASIVRKVCNPETLFRNAAFVAARFLRG
jgi:hypothetical protein